MASAQLAKVESDILTCSICIERFNDPVTLHCQHTYCRTCLGEHMVTKATASPGKPILCPVCNQDIRVPTPTRPVEEWAGQLKPGLVIQGLLDSLTMELSHSQETTFVACSLCEKLGKTSPGMMWCPVCDTILCDNCVQMHRVQPATIDHHLVGKSQKDKVKKQRREFCQKHPKEEIKVYCQDCNQKICQSCYFDSHRRCESVQSIQSMMVQMREYLTDHKKHLSQKCVSETRRNSRRKELLEKLSDQKQCTRGKIQTSFQIVYDKLREKEIHLLDELDAFTENPIQQLRADVKRGDIDMQKYEQLSEYIDHILESNSELSILDLYQVGKSGHLDIAQGQDNQTENQQQLMSVSFDTSIENIDETLTKLKLGYIVQHNCIEESTPVLHNRTDSNMRADEMSPESTPKLHNRTESKMTSVEMSPESTSKLNNIIESKTAADKTSPWLRDITVLHVEGVRTIAVTDYNNDSVKAFYHMNNAVCSSRVQLDGAPEGITRLNERQMIAVVSSSKQIVTLEVTPELVLLSTVNVGKEYYSIAVVNPATIAAGTNGCVDILNMKGQVMKSLSTYNNIKLFDNPFNMCADNEGNLLVSDLIKKCLTCMTPKGVVLWTYAQMREELRTYVNVPITHTGKLALTERALKHPSGVSVTPQGQILLADEEKVIRISKAGKFVGNVLTEKDGLITPVGVYVDDDDSLFLTDSGAIKEFVFV